MRNDYHSDYSRVSKSMLSTLISYGPEEYHRRYVLAEPYGHKSSPEMAVGSIVDAVVTECRPLDEIAAVYPEDVLSSRGAIIERSKQWAAEQPQEYIIKPEMMRRVQMTIETAEHAIAEAEIDHNWQAQQRFDANLYGTDCKCLCDFVHGDGTEIVDLKCMADISPIGFRRSAKAFHYWLQAVHYSACVQMRYQVRPTFKFLCVSTEDPGRYQWYWFDDDTLTRAGERHMDLLDEIRYRTAAGNWVTEWWSEIHLAPWDIDPDYNQKQGEEVVFDG